MIQVSLGRGIDVSGLDDAFLQEQRKVADLLIEAQILQGQNRWEEAWKKFAAAAEIETRLSEICDEKGLIDAYFVHRFSAASCYADSGNYWSAITMCEELLARDDLTERLRAHYSESLNTWRSRLEWLSRESMPEASEEAVARS